MNMELRPTSELSRLRDHLAGLDSCVDELETCCGDRQDEDAAWWNETVEALEHTRQAYSLLQTILADQGGAR